MDQCNYISADCEDVIWLHVAKPQVDEDLNILEGEREAEDMIVEAYTAVLLAFLSLERYLYTSSQDIFS